VQVDFPTLNDILSRLNTLEETIAFLQKSQRGKEDPPKEWYSVRETAAYLQCSDKTVRRLLKRGLLKRSAGLRHIRIHKSQLEIYLRRTTI
jgi:excisionase family DNA binding protein